MSPRQGDIGWVIIGDRRDEALNRLLNMRNSPFSRCDYQGCPTKIPGQLPLDLDRYHLHFMEVSEAVCKAYEGWKVRSLYSCVKLYRMADIFPPGLNDIEPPPCDSAPNLSGDPYSIERPLLICQKQDADDLRVLSPSDGLHMLKRPNRKAYVQSVLIYLGHIAWKLGPTCFHAFDGDRTAEKLLRIIDTFIEDGVNEHDLVSVQYQRGLMLARKRSGEAFGELEMLVAPLYPNTGG
ncbi:hypothetical protein BDV25DRAFT_135217 [Aspergillus avenaceus]|uniref:Uncharacterized protein n=1 Tax=Aspergillus avenaceus TaxID=36643 RepID=A0A5N6U9S1_ASPAV|nr:hypothetical protein BDV25DRAFT_135217 [Aspergillus avenaceus]